MAKAAAPGLPYGLNTSQPAPAVPELCALLGNGWDCRGTPTSTGFLLQLIKLPAGSLTLARGSCDSFLLLPAENTWSYQSRAMLYALGLAYCFVGLSTITAIFMEAMENIVKQRRKAVTKNTLTGATEITHGNIWNTTVADITLLAFGSSSPQISLAIIDSLKHLGESSIGGVGPGTIVGSAAFNLFANLAVCVLLPKGGAIKRIEKMGVFIVELTWSIWAYVWLFLMLKVLSPNEISLWEAILTVLQFPLLILHAYAEDRNWSYMSISFWSKMLAKWFKVVGTQDPSKLKQQPSAENEAELTCELGCSRYENAQAATLLSSSNGPSMERLGAVPAPQAQPSSLMKDEHEQIVGSLDSKFLTVEDAPGNCGLLVHQIPDSKVSLRDRWKAQLYYAMTIRGSLEEKDDPPRLIVLLKHALTMLWRVLFAIIIPADVCNGWPTFFCALLCVTGISTIVIELANLLGCVLGISKYVIALTVLASGTSWPELTASKIAVEHGKTADSGIANINSSNCINIFVGIGLSWLIQASYNRLKLSTGLSVETSGLSFSLVLYFMTFSLCWLGMFLRRRRLGGELGGPQSWARASSAYFLLLWLTFVTFSCLKNMHLI